MPDETKVASLDISGLQPKVQSEKSEPFARVIAIGLLLAIATAGVGYALSIQADQRKRKIEFVDQQIEKLYGPLLALSKATLQANQTLLSHFRPGASDYFDEHAAPTKADVERWRRWMKVVFQPMNIKMERAIVDNAQLIEGGHIYPAFSDLILHVESYKATITKWKDTDEEQNPHFLESTENTAVITFPKGFDDCVEKRFMALRAKRDSLNAAWIVWLLPVETADDSTFPVDCR
jgi:hypothetical protein